MAVEFDNYGNAYGAPEPPTPEPSPKTVAFYEHETAAQAP
jgi:hypothetical protein